MRTADAVTPMPGLAVPLVAFTALYIVLGVVVIVLLRALFRDVTPVSAAPGFAPRTGEDR